MSIQQRTNHAIGCTWYEPAYSVRMPYCIIPIVAGFPPEPSWIIINPYLTSTYCTDLYKTHIQHYPILFTPFFFLASVNSPSNLKPCFDALRKGNSLVFIRFVRTFLWQIINVFLNILWSCARRVYLCQHNAGGWPLAPLYHKRCPKGSCIAAEREDQVVAGSASLSKTNQQLSENKRIK